MRGDPCLTGNRLKMNTLKKVVTSAPQILKGRIALEPDISNVPGQTPQGLALSLSADNLSVVHAPSH